VFKSTVKGEKKYNSWFYVDFEKKVFVPKGASCSIVIKSENRYQMIPISKIRENIAKAKASSAFAYFDVYFHQTNRWGGLYFHSVHTNTEARYRFNVKSLSVALLET